jgi:hypothetical protein
VQQWNDVEAAEKLHQPGEEQKTSQKQSLSDSDSLPLRSPKVARAIRKSDALQYEDHSTKKIIPNIQPEEFTGTDTVSNSSESDR